MSQVHYDGVSFQPLPIHLCLGQGVVIGEPDEWLAPVAQSTLLAVLVGHHKGGLRTYMKGREVSQ